MSTGPWRFEPLSPPAFEVGSGPFRVRGLAYTAALEYADTRLAGGRGAMRIDAAFAPYFDQLFVTAGDYDVSPLVHLFVVMAAVKGVPVGDLVESRSRWSAKSDAHGIWKPLLKTSSPEAMGERMHLAFNRYFNPSEARKLAVAPGRFQGELVKLPQPMSGLFVCSTKGWVSGALALAGARRVDVSFEAPVVAGHLEGVPLVSARFLATWK